MSRKILSLLISLTIVLCGYSFCNATETQETLIGHSSSILIIEDPALTGNNLNSYVFDDEDLTGAEGYYNYLYNAGASSSINCYGYAINYNGWADPGDFGGNNNSYWNYQNLDSTNAAYLVDAVLDDLYALGYTHAHEVNASYVPSSGETVIAFRMGYTYGGYAYDYHFMKWSGSFWLHKPGNTAILRFKSTSLSSTWYPEAYFVNAGVWMHDNTFRYNGIVKYVAY